MPPRGDVVGGVLLHRREREDPRLGLLQHGLVDVGRVDAAAVVEAFLLEEDGHRVDLFARRTAGVPDAHERIGAQQRHDLLPEGEVEGRVAEHRRGVDGEVEQQPLHRLRSRAAPSRSGRRSVLSPSAYTRFQIRRRSEGSE